MRKQHVALFRKLVKSGEIAEYCDRYGNFNVDFPTFGGTVFWDSYPADGWNLQENSIFGNWRILDPDDTRRAWGTTEDQLEEFLHARPSSILANYLDEGYAFSRYAGTGSGTVVLIHGWGVRAVSMAALAKLLNRRGYSVLNYDYRSSERHIEDHAEIFLDRYRSEHLRGKIHFVTHSMGALVLRYALAGMTEEECRAIDSIVMLGPPNRGSILALIGQSELVRIFNSSLGDMAPGSDALDIPAPAYLPPTGIIAGTFDGKVALEDTSLPGGLPFERVTVDCTHPGLRYPRNTGELILNFLRCKNFG